MSVGIQSDNDEGHRVAASDVGFRIRAAAATPRAPFCYAVFCMPVYVRQDVINRVPDHANPDHVVMTPATAQIVPKYCVTNNPTTTVAMTGMAPATAVPNRDLPNTRDQPSMGKMIGIATYATGLDVISWNHDLRYTT